MFNLTTLNLADFHYTYDKESSSYYSSYDTSPIDVGIIHIDQNSTDDGPVAVVFFDGHPIFRTLTESERSTCDPLVPIEDEDTSIFGNGPNGRGRIYNFADHENESIFVAFLDAISYTDNAYENFVDASDTDHYHGSLVAEHIVDETRFSTFVAIVTEAVQKLLNYSSTMFSPN